MFCTKCHQREATVHLTTVMHATQETVHLCKDCAPFAGLDLDKIDRKQVEALSVVGKKCEFCGKAAFSGEMRTDGRAVYWCLDCGLERGVILQDLLVAERPELLQRSMGENSLLALCSDPALAGWLASASERATQTLKERRRNDGRDKGFLAG
jgi:hypothetical protein